MILFLLPGGFSWRRKVVYIVSRSERAWAEIAKKVSGVEVYVHSDREALCIHRKYGNGIPFRFNYSAKCSIEIQLDGKFIFNPFLLGRSIKVSFMFSRVCCSRSAWNKGWKSLKRYVAKPFNPWLSMTLLGLFFMFHPNHNKNPINSATNLQCSACAHKSDYFFELFSNCLTAVCK